MAKIFISYNRQSEAIAKTLADGFGALGHTAKSATRSLLCFLLPVM